MKARPSSESQPPKVAPSSGRPHSEQTRPPPIVMPDQKPPAIVVNDGRPPPIVGPDQGPPPVLGPDQRPPIVGPPPIVAPIEKPTPLTPVEDHMRPQSPPADQVPPSTDPGPTKVVPPPIAPPNEQLPPKTESKVPPKEALPPPKGKIPMQGRKEFGFKVKGPFLKKNPPGSAQEAGRPPIVMPKEDQPPAKEPAPQEDDRPPISPGAPASNTEPQSSSMKARVLEDMAEMKRNMNVQTTATRPEPTRPPPIVPK